MRTKPPTGNARSEYSVSPIPCWASSESRSAIDGLPAFATTAAWLEPVRRPMPRRQESTVGPMPTANASTRMPAQRAARKCPNSWMKMSRPKPSRIRMKLVPSASMERRFGTRDAEDTPLARSRSRGGDAGAACIVGDPNPRSVRLDGTQTAVMADPNRSGDGVERDASTGAEPDGDSAGQRFGGTWRHLAGRGCGLTDPT